MPFSWIININLNPAEPPRVVFDPNPLGSSEQQVEPGDQIVWANNDTEAHWPGLQNPNGTINKSYFMPNQIAPSSTSQAFSPASSGTLSYVCSLHPNETGTITIQDSWE